MTGKKKTGTREWAEVSKNIFLGCCNGCRYCYAKSRALRFNQIGSADEWKEMKLRDKALREKPRKLEGRIMFPTTHDIMPEHADTAVKYMRGWLEVGNKFLIVSKPRIAVIKRLCDELKEFSGQIAFRFTIGSLHNHVLNFWEPGASSFSERVDCLDEARTKGFATSISCEPYLDRGIIELVGLLADHTGTIWIGKMNRINSRVNTSGWAEDDFWYMREIERCSSNEFIMRIYDRLYNYDRAKILWKDSIRQVVGLSDYANVL